MVRGRRQGQPEGGDPGTGRHSGPGPDSGPVAEPDLGVIGRVVETEARRVLAADQFESDPVLVAQGWRRRFMTDGVRAQEAMELYSELGFEVRAEPVQAEAVTQDCADCQLLIALEFKTIYTRNPGKAT